METIRISEKKLKIMLCPADMWRYDLSVPIDITSQNGKNRLRRLLRDACGEGFDPDMGELLVQIYESAEGCELFVTQCEDRSGGKGMGMGMTNLTKSPAQRSRSGPAADTAAVYEFPDLPSLLSACARIRGRKYQNGARDTAAYADDNAYYLLTYESLDSVCGEYGGRRLDDIAHAYLTEHATCICRRDAVEVLSALE